MNNKQQLTEQCEYDLARRLPSDTASLSAAIAEFEAVLPGWWWRVCTCNLTRDASCGPDFRDERCSSEDIENFDEGFHCDHKGTLADALRDVMRQALEAKSHD